jgi:hypothetical protein
MQTIIVSADTKRRLTSLNLAHSGWRSAQEVLAEIHVRKLKPDFGLFEGLMTAACVLYARPFKKAKGIVPLVELANFNDYERGPQLLEVHRAAIDARDTVLAHQDVKKWPALVKGVPGARPVDELIVTFSGGPFAIESGGLLPPENLHELLPDLISLQLKRVDSLRFGLITGVLPPSFELPAKFSIETEGTNS